MRPKRKQKGVDACKQSSEEDKHTVAKRTVAKRGTLLQRTALRAADLDVKRASRTPQSAAPPRPPQPSVPASVHESHL